MGIVLPTLPAPALDETSPYCVIAKHRAKPGLADAYERGGCGAREELRPHVPPGRDVRG
jgi:hypothetical protein